MHDIVGLHNAHVFMQVVGNEFSDIWLLQTACFKCIFMQLHVFLSAGEWNTVVNYIID